MTITIIALTALATPFVIGIVLGVSVMIRSIIEDMVD